LLPRLLASKGKKEEAGPSKKKAAMTTQAIRLNICRDPLEQTR